MENKDKKAILVVSFGTSYQKTRERTLDVIERDLREAFAGYEFKRAYTSPTIVRILRERDKIQIDGVEEAFERLVKDGFGTVLVQTTHVIHGFEYDRMKESLTKYQHFFDHLALGEPLLTSGEDYQEVVRVLGQETEAFRRSGTDLILWDTARSMRPTVPTHAFNRHSSRQAFPTVWWGRWRHRPLWKAW